MKLPPERRLLRTSSDDTTTGWILGASIVFILGRNELFTLKVIYHAAEFYRQIVTLIDWVAGELLRPSPAPPPGRLDAVHRSLPAFCFRFIIKVEFVKRYTPDPPGQIIVHLFRGFCGLNYPSPSSPVLSEKTHLCGPNCTGDSRVPDLPLNVRVGAKWTNEIVLHGGLD